MDYYNGILTEETEAERRHEIDGCLKWGYPLTARQRAFYLLFMATPEQAKEFLKREKRGQKNVNSK
jgi:hypothetical protein